MNDFLEEKLDPEVRSELQKHLNECPNCWVVCDTTKKTIKIFKGMQAQLLPASVQTRLSEYLSKHCRSKKSESAGQQSQTGNELPPLPR